MTESTFAVFLKDDFKKYGFNSRIQRKYLQKQEGAFFVLEREGHILRGTSPLGEKGSWIPQDGTFGSFLKQNFTH